MPEELLSILMKVTPVKYGIGIPSACSDYVIRQSLSRTENGMIGVGHCC